MVMKPFAPVYFYSMGLLSGGNELSWYEVTLNIKGIPKTSILTRATIFMWPPSFVVMCFYFMDTKNLKLFQLSYIIQYSCVSFNARKQVILAKSMELETNNTFLKKSKIFWQQYLMDCGYSLTEISYLYLNEYSILWWLTCKIKWQYYWIQKGFFIEYETRNKSWLTLRTALHRLRVQGYLRVRRLYWNKRSSFPRRVPCSEMLPE